MPTDTAATSPRRAELLDLIYAYALEHGLTALSLRPLAGVVGSSPRVLLYLFGSKDGLVRAVLDRARAEELAVLAAVEERHPGLDLPAAAGEVWTWLSRPEHRRVMALWVESYGRSLVEPGGPWGEFAARTVADLLEILARYQPPARRRTRAGRAERTAALAVLRGALLDLLATGDTDRVTEAVRRQLRALVP